MEKAFDLLETPEVAGKAFHQKAPHRTLHVVYCLELLSRASVGRTSKSFNERFYVRLSQLERNIRVGQEEATITTKDIISLSSTTHKALCPKGPVQTTLSMAMASNN